MRPGPDGLRDDGLDDRRGLVEHRGETTGRALRALEGLCGDGKRRDELERGEGDQCDDGEEDTVEMSGVHGAHSERECGPHRHPRAEHDQPAAHSRGVRARLRDSSELTVVVDDSLHLRVDGAEGDEVGSALEQVDDRCSELAARWRAASFVAVRQRSRQPRDDDRSD